VVVPVPVVAPLMLTGVASRHSGRIPPVLWCSPGDQVAMVPPNGYFGSAAATAPRS
jgi:hypothetical protein